MPPIMIFKPFIKTWYSRYNTDFHFSQIELYKQNIFSSFPPGEFTAPKLYELIFKMDAIVPLFSGTLALHTPSLRRIGAKYYKCFFKNARPDPVLRYSSNFFAFFLSVKFIIVFNFQGRYLAELVVCPRL